MEALMLARVRSVLLESGESHARLSSRGNSVLSESDLIDQLTRTSPVNVDDRRAWLFCLGYAAKVRVLYLNQKLGDPWKFPKEVLAEDLKPITPNPSTRRKSHSTP